MHLKMTNKQNNDTKLVCVVVHTRRQIADVYRVLFFDVYLTHNDVFDIHRAQRGLVKMKC